MLPVYEQVYGLQPDRREKPSSINSAVESEEFNTKTYFSLYPNLLRRSFRSDLSFSVSVPLGLKPSITPSTPRPCSLCATRASTGFAVAQNIRQTSGHPFTALRQLIGNASRIRIKNVWCFEAPDHRTSRRF